jgi:hypothetical protein
MPLGHLENGRIPRLVRSRRFECECAGVGHADVCGCRVGSHAQRLVKRLASARHLLPIQRLERRTPLDERTLVIEHGGERHVRHGRAAALDRRQEPVTPPQEGLDVRRPVVLVAKHLAQARHGLHQAVVGHGYVTPGGVGEGLLGNDFAGPGNQ